MLTSSCGISNLDALQRSLVTVGIPLPQRKGLSTGAGIRAVDHLGAFMVRLPSCAAVHGHVASALACLAVSSELRDFQGKSPKCEASAKMIVISPFVSHHDGGILHGAVARRSFHDPSSGSTVQANANARWDEKFNRHRKQFADCGVSLQQRMQIGPRQRPNRK